MNGREEGVGCEVGYDEMLVGGVSKCMEHDICGRRERGSETRAGWLADVNLFGCAKPDMAPHLPHPEPMVERALPVARVLRRWQSSFQVWNGVTERAIGIVRT